jgi:DNA-directed RNA polymerase subunit RPC12/RpoP
MSWICENELCAEFNIEKTEAIEKISFDNEWNKHNSAERCPECGHRRIDTSFWTGTSFSSPGNKNICNK